MLVAVSPNYVGVHAALRQGTSLMGVFHPFPQSIGLFFFFFCDVPTRDYDEWRQMQSPFSGDP
jgi:hypothetical protein